MEVWRRRTFSRILQEVRVVEVWWYNSTYYFANFSKKIRVSSSVSWRIETELLVLQIAASTVQRRKWRQRILQNFVKVGFSVPKCM
jgi:hypothetical protein